jgi:hypothetical protein
MLIGERSHDKTYTLMTCLLFVALIYRKRWQLVSCQSGATDHIRNFVDDSFLTSSSCDLKVCHMSQSMWMA